MHLCIKYNRLKTRKRLKKNWKILYDETYVPCDYKQFLCKEFWNDISGVDVSSNSKVKGKEMLPSKLFVLQVISLDDTISKLLIFKQSLNGERYPPKGHLTRFIFKDFNSWKDKEKLCSGQTQQKVITKELCSQTWKRKNRICTWGSQFLKSSAISPYRKILGIMEIKMRRRKKSLKFNCFKKGMDEDFEIEIGNGKSRKYFSNLRRACG